MNLDRLWHWPCASDFFNRKAIHLPMSISGSYASNSMLHITSYRWPKRNLNKSDVSAPTKAWNTRRWLSAWMKLRWKSRRVNFYDASYTTPSWYVPFRVIKPSEHIRGCLLWLNFCCLLLCTTQICKVEIYVHPQTHLKKPWSISRRFGVNLNCHDSVHCQWAMRWSPSHMLITIEPRILTKF